MYVEAFHAVKHVLNNTHKGNNVAHHMYVEAFHAVEHVFNNIHKGNNVEQIFKQILQLCIHEQDDINNQQQNLPENLQNFLACKTPVLCSYYIR